MPYMRRDNLVQDTTNLLYLLFTLHITDKTNSPYIEFKSDVIFVSRYILSMYVERVMLENLYV